METLVGEIFVHVEEDRGIAMEGSFSEDKVEQRDVVDAQEQGEEEELDEGLLVLILIPRLDIRKFECRCL